MISLGVLSVFQIIFIPGFILLYILKFKTRNTIQTLILSFGLSLAINYFLVYLLTLTGIYRPITVYLIFTLEIIFLFFLFFKKKINYLFIFNKRKPLNSGNLIIYNLSLLILLIFILLFITNIGKVFDQWDAVFSWNRWASYWYFNELPSKTGFYPQLIPANWSLTYVFINSSEIQLFAKSIMPLFSLAIIAIFFELYISTKKIAYLISLIIFGSITGLYSFIHIQSGYVDIPVAFFSFLAFYLIIDQNDSPIDLRKIFFIVLFASSAAMTKQAGFFILIFVFFWILWFVFIKKEGIKKTLYAVFISIGTITAFLSWYFVKIYEVQRGFDFSNTSYLLRDIHGDLNYLERILSGLKKFPDFGLILLILLIFVFIGVLLKKYITIPVFIIIPYFLIWGLFFSYDRRNLTIIFPFLALSSAFGISSLAERFNNKKNRKLSLDHKSNRTAHWIYLGLIFLLSVIFISLEYILRKLDGIKVLLNVVSQIRGNSIAGIWSEKINDILTFLFYIGILMLLYGIYLVLIKMVFNKREKIIINLKWIFTALLVSIVIILVFAGLNSERIIEYQIDQRKTLGNQKLNELLYDYQENNSINGRIITDYYWLSVLPGFYSSPKNTFIDNEMIQIISNVPPYSPYLGAIDSNTWGILISENYFSGEKFKETVEEKLDSNEFEIIFIEEEYTIQKNYFIKINQP